MTKSLISILACTLATFLSFSVANAQTTTVGKGRFTGASNHVTSGVVEVVKNADGSHTVILADDFSLDGAPDPRVGLGKDGKYDKATGMGLLKSLKGHQTFSVPAGVNPADYNEVYIWCLKFNVPLGVAPLL